MIDKETLVTNDHTPRLMRPEDKSYRDVMMLFSDQPVKPKYWFKDFGDYWSCSCGQINRGATCSNCGLERELLRRLFQVGSIEAASEPVGDTVRSNGNAAGGTEKDDHLHDTEAQEPSHGVSGAEDTGGAVAFGHGPYEESEEEREAADYRKRKRRTRIILIITLFLITLLGCGLAAFYFYGLPEMDRRADMEADTAKDSLARELPDAVPPVNDYEFDINRNLGDHYYDKKEYEKAIEYYIKTLKIKDDASVRHKVEAAKFSYVSENRDKGGAVFEEYLDDLFKAKYSGINDIYYSYYTWKTSIVTNTGANDYSTDMTTINRAFPIYFHTTLSGGPPKESLDLYYEITWPDGTTEKRAISSTKSSGETVTTTCQYTFPARPGEGKLTYKLFNNSNNKQIATDSVTLQ